MNEEENAYLNWHLYLLSNPAATGKLNSCNLMTASNHVYGSQSNRNFPSENTHIYHACFITTGGIVQIGTETLVKFYLPKI